jgi:hypothetical protein
MSVFAIGWAIDQEVSDPSVKLTLILLANCMNDVTGKCCPGLRYLAERCGQSERTVQRNLQRLVDEGKVERRPRFHGTGRQGVNDYSLKMPAKSPLREGDAGVWGRATRASGKGGTGVGGEGDVGVTPKREPERVEPERESERGTERGRPPENPTDFLVAPATLAQPESGAVQFSSPQESYETTATQPPPSKKGRVRETRTKMPIPADLELDEEMHAYAVERGWDRARCEGEFEHFKNYYAAEGKLLADWSAGWRNWVLRGLRFNEKERQEKRSRRATGPTAMVDTLLAHAARVAGQEYAQ